MGVLATAAAAPTPLFVASTTPQMSTIDSSQSYTIALPAGLQQNDVLFAAIASSQTPDLAGWTALTSIGAQMLFWTRRGASNPSNTITGQLYGSLVSSWCAAYRGCKTSGNPYELFTEADVQPRYSGDNGGPLTAADVMPSGVGRLILNIMQTVISAPSTADNIQFGTDTGWTSQLDATVQGVDQQGTQYHCWAEREIAGVSGVAQPGVTFSGGDGQSRIGTAFSLALL